MRICMIGNAGGHLEQLKQLRQLKDYYEIYYVTNKSISNKDLKYINYYIKAPHGKNRLSTMIGYFINTVQAIYILFRIRPQIIISTGAGIAVPIICIGKMLGIKIIFIESFARMETPSKTGKLIYKMADTFIIQHRQLAKYYPKALYGGWIY